MNKKGTMILFGFGIVYIFVGVSYFNNEVILNQRTILSFSFFAFFISLAELTESITDIIIFAFYSEKQKQRLIVKTFVYCIITTLHVLAVFFLVLIPLLISINNKKMEVFSNTVTILSFAFIFLSIAIRDYDMDLKIKQQLEGGEKTHEKHS